jgi:kynurenine formamidase
MSFEIIDLTHTLTNQSPTWDGNCGFNHEITLDYHQFDSKVKFRVQKINMHAGIGTHMDAPAHCFQGAKTTNDFTLDELMAPCVMIDVSTQAHERYSLSIEDIQKYEANNGKIEENAFVVVYTGWERFWTKPRQYHNNHLFPSISSDAGKFLLHERNISGIGIDTLSPDRPEDGYPIHELFLGASKYIIENIANAVSLAPIGDTILALPFKADNLTEAPVRLIAIRLKVPT